MESPREVPGAGKTAAQPTKLQVTRLHAAQLSCTPKKPLYAAPPLLQRMVDAGRLGRKTGSGFYPYS
ncbi:3-hydroxyacyl-CoA dehydrogenase family protein [Streptomyces finlayi]|uniref:3-hydroxyacyl-CoA dehydrogenase family protein n=1 Tax=Streptomyces finlayi TaxID=67296 RepID=UPI0035BC6D4B